MTDKKRMVTIDDKQYDFDTLSDNAKTQLANIRITDAELRQLNTRIGITQTARIAYANALKAELEK
ncbi:MAG: DUF6447 family protein [Desulfuromonadaceae bacterium]|nr:DUF6447 family protein [Desulfuromonadaceae bacterium]